MNLEKVPVEFLDEIEFIRILQPVNQRLGIVTICLKIEIVFLPVKDNAGSIPDVYKRQCITCILSLEKYFLLTIIIVGKDSF